MVRTPLVASLLLCCSSAALAQPNISPFHKFAWSENCGWSNWKDSGSPSGASGVRLHNSFLSGFAWCENAGYLNFGDGTPTDGRSYANLDGTDFGVNLRPSTGALTGLAWGENIGWINFTLPTLPTAQQPRFDTATQRLRGYAWGENIGWINLDDATHFIALGCPADLDDGSGTGTPDGGVTIEDLLYFLALFTDGQLGADLDDGSGTGTPDGGVTIDDLLYFLERFANGC